MVKLVATATVNPIREITPKWYRPSMTKEEYDKEEKRDKRRRGGVARWRYRGPRQSTQPIPIKKKEQPLRVMPSRKCKNEYQKYY
jgi:hypothetical protein